MNQRLFWTLSFLLVFAATSVQGKPQLFENPYQVISWHLNHLKPTNYQPELAAEALFPGRYTVEERKELAIKLHQIMAGVGCYVKYTALPMEEAYKDSAGRFRYAPCSLQLNIYVEKTDKGWHYSAHTLEAIDALHAKIYPRSAAFILGLIPQWGNQTFAGLFIWQYISVLGLIVGGGVAYQLFKWLFRLLIVRLSRRKNSFALRDEIKAVAKPLALFCITYLVKYFFPALELPLWFSGAAVFVLRALLPIFVVMTAYNLIDLLAKLFSTFAQKTNSNLDEQFVPLFRKTFKVVVAVIGTIIVLRSINVDVMTFVAGVSVIGLALALAAQDSVKNFLGSITILLDGTFQIGEYIEVDGKGGVVQEVGFRSTRIRNNDGSIISIPNSKLMDAYVTNSGIRKYRKFSPKISLSSSTPVPILKTFVGRVQALIDQKQLTSNKDNRVVLGQLDSKTLELVMTIYFEDDIQDESQMRAEIIYAILEIAEELGVKLE